MNRRKFLRYAVTWGVSLAFRNSSSHAGSPPKPSYDKNVLQNIKIIDAHAHPDKYITHSREIDETSTVKAISELGMVASCFAAVGDRVYLSQDRISGDEHSSTKTQLDWWIKGIVKSGKVKIIRKASDIPNTIGPGDPPGAILSIEGGDPLAGNPDRVDEFYKMGVRIITVVHYRNNKLGDTMKRWGTLNPGPMNNGLSPVGRKVVERMQELGMVVDVAHAHPATLGQIVEMGAAPLVDSHTSPCSFDDSTRCGRFRTWKDMELIAKGDGVVCTWPLGYKGEFVRASFLDWAKETLEMVKRLGKNHVGLGTDGGGQIPSLIEGYRDVRDLVHLGSAMQEVGFSLEEIAAYMGGNFYRVLQKCIG